MRDMAAMKQWDTTRYQAEFLKKKREKNVKEIWSFAKEIRAVGFWDYYIIADIETGACIVLAMLCQ